MFVIVAVTKSVVLMVESFSSSSLCFGCWVDGFVLLAEQTLTSGIGMG